MRGCPGVESPCAIPNPLSTNLETCTPNLPKRAHKTQTDATSPPVGMVMCWSLLIVVPPAAAARARHASPPWTPPIFPVWRMHSLHLLGCRARRHQKQRQKRHRGDPGGVAAALGLEVADEPPGQPRGNVGRLFPVVAAVAAGSAAEAAGVVAGARLLKVCVCVRMYTRLRAVLVLAPTRSDLTPENFGCCLVFPNPDHPRPLSKDMLVTKDTTGGVPYFARSRPNSVALTSAVQTLLRLNPRPPHYSLSPRRGTNSPPPALRPLRPPLPRSKRRRCKGGPPPTLSRPCSTPSSRGRRRPRRAVAAAAARRLD